MSKDITEQFDSSLQENYFKQKYIETFGQDRIDFCQFDISRIKPKTFVAHTVSGVNFNGTSRKSMSGDIEEFLREQAQNTGDGGGKRIAFELTQLPRELFEDTLSLSDFFKEKDNGNYPIKDSDFANIYTPPNDIFNSIKDDFFPALVVKDDGRGLDGAYNYMFAKPEFLEKLEKENPEEYNLSVAAFQERAKQIKQQIGGAIAYWGQDSVSSKGDGEGGSHNTGGKNSVEMASKINTALQFTRRKEDDTAVFCGHAYIGMRSGNKRTFNQRAILQKENGDLINGKEAMELAEAFQVDRKSGQFGLTNIIPLPIDDYNFTRILGFGLFALPQMILNHNLTFVVTDKVNGYHVEVNKKNIEEVYHKFCLTAKDMGFNEGTRNKTETEDNFKKIYNFYPQVEHQVFMHEYVSKLTQDDAIKVEGFNPSKPALSEHDKEIVQEKFHKGLPIFLEYKMKLKKFFKENGVSVARFINTKFYMVLYRHGAIDGINSFDRSGINMRFPNNLKEQVSSVIFLPKGEEINNFCRAAEDTNHTKWNTTNNSYLKENYDNVAGPLRHLNSACRNMVDYLVNDHQEERDFYTFAAFFADEEDISFKSSNAVGGYRTPIKSEDTQDWNDIKKASKAKSDDLTLIDETRYLNIYVDQANQTFVILPTLEAQAECFVPDFDISLAFKALGLTTSHRYGSTVIQEHWEVEGLPFDCVSFNKTGTVMHVRDISNFEFEIRIINPDTMRIPDIEVRALSEAV